ncbi:hypothetical protein DFH11DRAFT_1567255 [Phellopilus nigrolimitatus]|nr:hypothetical protein DFH11DRAFT_1567255 [Phellopilus nigrolimitatus]
MALQPSLSPLLIAGKPGAPHTLDIFGSLLGFFIRYNNSISAKLVFTIDKVLKPLLDAGGKYDGKVKAIIRLQVQPWHSSSTLVHESALALFRNQNDFFDIPTSNLTPTQIREKLIALALPVVGSDKKGALVDLLTFKGTPNGGIAFSRQNSIHVTPTVVGEVSSSWGEQEWNDFLKAKVTV